MILTEEEKELVQKHRDGYLGVYWHVDDFKNAAENLDGNGVTYDPDKFQYALEVMIDKHDACIGISWDVLGIYLNEYCVADEESI